jgi:hypothetical protein
MLKFKLSDAWIDISGDRKMQRFENFTCVIPTGYEPGMPFGCPICDILFADHHDVEAYYVYGCCKECSYNGAQANNED